VLYGFDADVRRLFKTVSALLKDGIHPEGQMLQDAFVVSRLGRRKLSFMDVGAAMPRKYSNTFMLQDAFDGHGVLVEPHPVLAEHLRQERASSRVVVLQCAAGNSDRHDSLIEFGPLSTLASGVEPDMFTRLREKRLIEGRSLQTEVQSMRRILNENGLVGGVAFLSIDVEGADLEVLKAYPMEIGKPNLIVIEHNLNRTVENQINQYLIPLGYKRVCSRWSSIDSWFVLED
jgi:FkbM family methyltransferase